ncbi:MAG: hypothetical protein BWY14_00219 [Parcubacteria group bacterium ADurb.Bin192]|nr:MAG: hypothetical protein BWY14_00219 [Parcubacteria group bacterium ADurb.Bin192]
MVKYLLAKLFLLKVRPLLDCQISHVDVPMRVDEAQRSFQRYSDEPKSYIKVVDGRRSPEEVAPANHTQ